MEDYNLVYGELSMLVVFAVRWTCLHPISHCSWTLLVVCVAVRKSQTVTRLVDPDFPYPLRNQAWGVGAVLMVHEH